MREQKKIIRDEYTISDTLVQLDCICVHYGHKQAKVWCLHYMWLTFVLYGLWNDMGWPIETHIEHTTTELTQLHVELQ